MRGTLINPNPNPNLDPNPNLNLNPSPNPKPHCNSTLYTTPNPSINPNPNHDPIQIVTRTATVKVEGSNFPLWLLLARMTLGAWVMTMRVMR